MGRQQQRGADRRSFRDLAQLASPPPPRRRESISEIRERSGSGDSGMIDLEVLAASDPGAVDRASVTPLASSPLFDVDESPTAPRLSPVPSPASSAAPLSARPAGAPSVPALSLPTPLAIPSAVRIVNAQAALQSAPEAPSSKKSGRAAILIGLVALAAGAFVAVRAARSHAGPVAATEAPTTIQAAALPTPAAPIAAAAGSPNGTAPVVAAADHGVDPLSLPAAGSTTKANGHRAHGSRSAHAAHAAVAAAAAAANESEDDADDAPAPVAATPKAEAPKAEAKVAAQEPAPSSGSLGDAINKAAAPESPASAPITPAAAAVAPSDATSQRPSQGAVTSALRSVIPEASKCLGPDDGVSRAHVVFASAGTVQETDVTGFAAGKPAEACIKAALGKAHVPAFAESTFGATVTIRP